jgi:catechol 2,3-dioxygenase-like lactoylglutathione lyase family enzyme
MINGIQHIGIGVIDRDQSFAFYNSALGFSVPMSKSTDTCSGMLPVLGKDETRNVVIALNPHGGGLIEIFQYISRKPIPIPDDIDFTCKGYLFYGLKVRNIDKSIEKIKRGGGTVLTSSMPFTPMQDKRWKTAVFRDPDGIYGILLEYPQSTVGYGRGSSRIGGIEYVAVGVSDIERSMDFYSRVLGYDDVLYTYEGTAPEWTTFYGQSKKLKRALLQRSTEPRGLFRHFLRGGMVELIEVQNSSRRHCFDGRKWGDVGVMELCFDVDDISETLKQIEKMGIPIAVPPHSQDMGLKTHATFAYIRDPDGSLLEFADIKRLPVPYFVIRLFVNPFVISLAKKLRLLK